MPASRRAPTPLLVLLGLTVLGTVLARTVWPGIYLLLRRDPDGLRHGQVWRLVTPLFVEPDPVPVAVVVIAFVALVTLVAARFFGVRRTLWLYLGGGLVAEVVGNWWQPHGSGVLVAGCGVLGGLAYWWLRMRAPGPVSAGAGVILVAGLALSVRDVHGIAIAVGFATGLATLGDVPPTYRGRVRGREAPSGTHDG